MRCSTSARLSADARTRTRTRSSVGAGGDSTSRISRPSTPPCLTMTAAFIMRMVGEIREEMKASVCDDFGFRISDRGLAHDLDTTTQLIWNFTPDQSQSAIRNPQSEIVAGGSDWHSHLT